MTIKLLSFLHTIIHFFVLGSSKIFWKKWGGHLAVKTVQIITKIQSMQWAFLDFLCVTLPVRHNVFPLSISNKRFAKIDKQIEYSWVVDNVYPKTGKDFTRSVLFIMPYLLIQIGKAPVKKLQRHLNSLIPRYLNILKLFKVGWLWHFYWLEMLEPKPRNIQDDCDASNLGSFLHSDELKQSEGCCEQFLAARHSGIPLTKPKL